MQSDAGWLAGGSARADSGDSPLVESLPATLCDWLVLSVSGGSGLPPGARSAPVSPFP